MDFVFLLSSVLLGAGLAMDAFSVSLANGFHEPGMGWKKISFMAGIFAFFQWLMPMAGWICVHIIVEVFQFFASYIPWIACFLLCFIGVSMVKEGFSGDAGHIRAGVGKKALLLQLGGRICLCSHYCGSNICGLCGRGNDRQEIRSEAGG